MAAILNTVILNSALLDSAILHKTLTQTNSIWLKLIHSHSTWRCQPSWILPLGFSHFEQKKFTHSFSLNLRMAAIFNSTILDSAILHKKNFTHSFSLNLVMAAILNSAIMNLAILDSAILVFSLKLTHTCQDWFPPFAHKKLHSFILTQLDDGSHLEICHVGFSHCHLGFRHLVIFSEIHSETLSLHSDPDSN